MHTSRPGGAVDRSSLQHDARRRVSQRPWAGLNLGDHVDDDVQAVAENRHAFARNSALPGEPQWLQQVHGTRVSLPGAHARNAQMPVSRTGPEGLR